jgi:hypothetical protein
MALVAGAFAILGASTAFATSANFSPAFRTACYSTTVNYSLSWGGNQPFDVDFYTDDSDGDEAHYVSVTTTSDTYPGAEYRSPDVYSPDMWVYDYGCGGSCGVAHKSGTITVNPGGVGGCPLGPENLDTVISSQL